MRDIFADVDKRSGLAEARRVFVSSGSRHVSPSVSEINPLLYVAREDPAILEDRFEANEPKLIPSLPEVPVCSPAVAGARAQRYGLIVSNVCD